MISEEDGFGLVNLNFSRPLPYDSKVTFQYNDTVTASGKLYIRTYMHQY